MTQWAKPGERLCESVFFNSGGSGSGLLERDLRGPHAHVEGQEAAPVVSKETLEERSVSFFNKEPVTHTS